jgi:hypothetical protein
MLYQRGMTKYNTWCFYWSKTLRHRHTKLYYYVTSALGTWPRRILKLFQYFDVFAVVLFKVIMVITIQACMLEQLQLWICSENRNYTSYTGLSTKTAVILLHTEQDPKLFVHITTDAILLQQTFWKELMTLLSFKCLSLRWGQQKRKRKKLRDFSPQANYTDRVTAACRRS